MSASSIRSRRSRFIVQIRRTSFVLKLFALSLFALPLHPASAAALSAPAAPALASVLVQSSGAADSISVDGVLVAIRQTSIASQIAGTVQALYVKVGDQVKEGQLLLRIDARAATQQSQASLAQVSASRAALDVAGKDVERQRQLFKQRYISQAALDRAEAEFRVTTAQLGSQIAQAGAAQAQTDYYQVRAPYTGVISDVPLTLGDMAMPGRPLLTIVDPSALRIEANLAQTVAQRLARLPTPQSAATPSATSSAASALRIELAGQPFPISAQQASRLQILPTMDPDTHTVQIRLDLPVQTADLMAKHMPTLSPGMFARLWLPLNAQSNAQPTPQRGTHFLVPTECIVRRAELTAVYVLNAEGKPRLRQVKLGPSQGQTIEILAGVSVGERIALDVQAAARLSPTSTTSTSRQP